MNLLSSFYLFIYLFTYLFTYLLIYLFIYLLIYLHIYLRIIWYAQSSFLLGELEESTGTPPYYVDEDYPAGPEISEPLRERSN